MSIFIRTSRLATTLAAVSAFSLSLAQAQTANRNLAASSNVASLEPMEPGVATSSSTGSVPASRTPQWHETVVPADKQITAKITSGVLTVDGLVAKVHMNYDVHHASYLYFFVPGVGTAVVSRVETYGSTRVANALRGDTLAFNVGGHDFELTSTTPIGESKGKSDIYVHLDTDTVALDRMPMMGFGSTTQAPYAWPLSGQETKDKDVQAHFVTPPALPVSILPRTVPVVSTTPAVNSLDK